VAKARNFKRLAPLCFLFLATYQEMSIDLHRSDVMADMIGYGRPKRRSTSRKRSKSLPIFWS
jgi:hypothetical protein